MRYFWSWFVLFVVVFALAVTTLASMRLPFDLYTVLVSAAVAVALNLLLYTRIEP